MPLARARGKKAVMVFHILGAKISSTQLGFVGAYLVFCFFRGMWLELRDRRLGIVRQEKVVSADSASGGGSGLKQLTYQPTRLLGDNRSV